jgi:hypothetical protein
MSDIEFGEEVLSALDAAKFPITVALWLRETQEDAWELVLGTPLYDRPGPKDAYRRLTAAFSADGRVPMGDLPIRLESNRRPLIKGLRRLFAKAASVKGMRLGLQSIGDVWIDDAYVYRIR